MGKIKRVFLLMTVLLMILLVCYCGRKENMGEQLSSESETRGKKAELEYYIWDDEEIYTRKVVDAFNTTFPNIQVNIHVIKNEIYDDIIGDVINGHDQVDLIGIRGVTKIITYQQKGYLLELTDYLKKSDLDLTTYGNMVYSYTINDEYYGLPTRSTYWVLYYNKEIFRENGIPYPEQMTWEEYAQTAKLLTNDKTGEDKVWGGYFINWLYYFAGVQRQNYLYDDDITQTMETLKWLNRFYNEDKSHIPLEDVIAIGDNWLEIFEKGQVAMMPQGEWTVSMLLADEEENGRSVEWDIAPMPIFENQEKYTTYGQYQFAGITQECRYPDEAFQFLSYLCGEEGARMYAGSGIISGYTNDEIRQIYHDSAPEKNTNVFFESQRVLELPPVPEYDDLLSVLKEISESYLLGKISYEEAIEKMEKRRKELYQYY